MDPGQSSGTKDDDQVWAKLVPSDSRYRVIEIRSPDTIICSKITDSSPEKHAWCRITRGPGANSATIRSASSLAIIVNGAIVGEEVVDIASGSEIISGPDNKDISISLHFMNFEKWSGSGLGTSLPVPMASISPYGISLQLLQSMFSALPVLQIKLGYLSYTYESIPSQDHNETNVKISFNVEHAKCSICLNIWHDVVTVAPCLHNFCNGCFSEWLRRSSSQSRDKHQSVVCPQCRATVHSVGRNHFLHNIEEAILQAFSSLKRTEEEMALLDTYASVKPNIVLGMPISKSRKRALSVSSNESSDTELPCPQCGTDLGGFRCSQTTAHIQCQGCGGMMPSRPNIGVPQRCVGCDRAFCGAYWLSQGVSASEFNTICSQETFKPISGHSVSRIPDTTHQSNIHEIDITGKCIQQTGNTLQTVISDWIIKFENREIDRTRLQINRAETITARSHLCRDCFSKFVDFLLYWFRVATPKHLLPPEASQRQDCWYGYACRTQHHNPDHARKRNHVCRPTRVPANP